MEINTFEEWMDTLAEALKDAKEMGMSEELLEKGAVKMGEFLAQNIHPDVPENRFLKDLWEISNEEEKRLLARMMIKYVEKYQAKH